MNATEDSIVILLAQQLFRLLFHPNPGPKSRLSLISCTIARILGPRERPERPVPLRFALRLRPLVLNLSLLPSFKRKRPLIRQRPFIKQDHAPIPSVRIIHQHKRHGLLSDFKQAAILLFSSNRIFHPVIPAAVLRPLFNPTFNTSSRHQRQGFSIEQDRFTYVEYLFHLFSRFRRVKKPAPSGTGSRLSPFTAIGFPPCTASP